MSTRDYHIEADSYGCGFSFVGADADALRRYACILDLVASSTLRMAEKSAHEVLLGDDTLPHLTNIITGARLAVQLSEAMHREAMAIDKDEARGVSQ